MAKQATRTSIVTDQKYLGREPEFDGKSVLSSIELVRVYNWYNHFRDFEDSKQYVQDFCKQNDIKISISLHHNKTFGWLTRALLRGARVDDHTLEQLWKYLVSLKRKEPARSTTTTEAREPTAFERLERWLPDFEEAVDNYKAPFSAYNYLTTRSVPQTYAKMIMEYYEPLYQELKLAYDKEDQQYVEAYKHLRRPDHKAYMQFVKGIIDDCEKYLGNVKKERKPRKKREKSVDSLLKHFKYQKSDTALKITSEDPSKIIGASSVYVLNTKYKTLTVFHAKKDQTLSVSRTSIVNYDEATTCTKRVGRQLEKVINDIAKGTKRSRMKIMDSIKAEKAAFTDRLNESSIILKIDK